MKKLIAVVLCLIMSLTMTCAAFAEGEQLEGGWFLPEDDAAGFAALEKATAESLGVDIEPVACVGMQVVAGTNYAVLVKSTLVIADPVPTYEIYYVYEDLEGNCELLDTQLLVGIYDAEVTESVTSSVSSAIVSEIEPSADICGGMTPTDDWTVTDELAEMLANATEELVGAEYEPVAYLGNQIVAGTNHLLLCKITYVTAEPLTKYVLVTVYEDLEGNASLGDVVDIELGL